MSKRQYAGVRGTVEGLPGVLKKLEGLKAAVRKKVTKAAVNKASRVLLKATKAEVTQRTGYLRKAMGRKVKLYSGSGVAVALVGHRTKWARQVGVRVRGKKVGQPIMQDPGKYAHLVDLGTKRSRAKPYRLPALAASKDQMLEAMAAEVEKGIAKAIK